MASVTRVERSVTDDQTPEIDTDVERRLRSDLEEATKRFREAEETHEALLADDSVIQEDLDASAQLLANTRGVMVAADAALANLAGGTYGRCEVCGNPIPPERLEAVPGVTRCVNCSS